MKRLKVVREQQIALFGEAGSGKTVLLSSFYGAAQERGFLHRNLYKIVASDTGQGRRLHQNYLGMKNAGTTPMTDHFRSSRYAFSIKQGVPPARSSKKPAAADLELIWHDYPGEWFEEEPTTEEERRRRTETFRALLGSDVAVLLVDGQRLLDNAAEEERYLKVLLTNYSTHVAGLRDDLLSEGKKLVRFPRIWLFGLSKADLLPTMDVTAFRDLMVEKVGHEVTRLQDELASFVEEPEAFSLGEDFVLLSSARFEVDKINVEQQIGVHLMLPIAAVLPFSRHIRWAKALQTGNKVAVTLMQNAGLAMDLIGKLKLPGKLRILTVVLPVIADALFEGSSEKVSEEYNKARARHDFLAAVLLGFQVDLNRAITDNTLLKSPK